MKAYELQKPDGSPSGVWCCGICHYVHASINCTPDESVSQMHQESAEWCCHPDWDAEWKRRFDRLVVHNIATGAKMSADEWLRSRAEVDTDSGPREDNK